MPGIEKKGNHWRARQKDPSNYKSFATKPLSDGVMAVYGITADGKSEIQSLLFDDKKFPKKSDVQAWLKAHNFRGGEALKKLTTYESVAAEGLEVFDFSESASGVKTVKIRMITSGLTRDKQRYYTREALESAATKFRNAKMYLNHISESERINRPERSIEDYVATITDAVYTNGEGNPASIVGTATIHGSPKYEAEKIYAWLKTMQEARGGADLSIHAFLLGEPSEIDGQPVFVVTDIDDVISVDFVTAGNAGGKVESVEALKIDPRGGEDMTELTLEKLKDERPDIVEALKKEFSDSEKNKDERISELSAQVEALQKELDAKKLEEKKEALLREAEALVKEAKLPEVTETKVWEKIKSILITEKTESIKSEVESIIKMEKEYLESLMRLKIFANDALETRDAGKSIDEMLKNITQKHPMIWSTKNKEKTN